MVAMHLVRHGEPRQDATRPPWEWELSAGAAARVKALRRSGVLPAHALWVSSPEPKAASTAALLTDTPVRLDDDLREAGRDGELLATDAFLGRVLESFADLDSPAAPGWEPLRAAQARMVAVAERAVAEAGGRDVVLVGHGTAMTMLVTALTNTPPDVRGWQRMLLPDHCCLTGRGGITMPWGHWAA